MVNETNHPFRKPDSQVRQGQKLKAITADGALEVCVAESIAVRYSICMLLRSSVVHFLFTTLLLGLLAGCAGPRMMPAPVTYETGSINPFENVAVADRQTDIGVLYATDRAYSAEEVLDKRYEKQRGLSLRLGMATVRFGPEDLDWQTLEDKSRSNAGLSLNLLELEDLGRLWTTIPLSDEDFWKARDSVSWDDDIRLPARRFVEEVNARLAVSKWKEIVIYVPGVNTPFISPVNMMAQFAHFMGRDGVFIAFSWPARGNPFSYSKQLTSAGTSVRNLRQLILLLATETTAERINLIAYSAGSPIMSNALLQIRLLLESDRQEDIRRTVPIGSVIYAGADEDHDYFRNMYLDGFQQLADSITIYTSDKDRALRLSKIFTTGSARLGRVSENLTPNDLKALEKDSHTSLIDVENAKSIAGKGDPFAHGYWYGNSWVNQDVINLLRTHIAPGERGLILDDDSPIWTFPDDYPVRAQDIGKLSDN